MFGRIFWPALSAGCVAGLVLAVLQVLLTTPIILHAEQYETAAVELNSSAMPAGLAQGGTPLPQAAVWDDRDGDPVWSVWKIHGGSEGAHASWAPANGLERLVYTAVTAVLVGVGYGLLLVSAYALADRPMTPRAGLAWGMAGFVTFSLAPALGLPPELPGSAAADLMSRQIWWAGTVIATGLGIAALVFGASRLWIAAGIVLIALPHIVGAPHAGGYTSTAPAELAGHFAAVSLAVSAVFWVVLGTVSATLWRQGESRSAKAASVS
jgi:cobalt transporter subunit CbtA